MLNAFVNFLIVSLSKYVYVVVYILGAYCLGLIRLGSSLKKYLDHSLGGEKAFPFFHFFL
jgi:hypothetical protein